MGWMLPDIEKVRVQKWRCLRCGFVHPFTKPEAVEACAVQNVAGCDSFQRGRSRLRVERIELNMEMRDAMRVKAFLLIGFVALPLSFILQAVAADGPHTVNLPQAKEFDATQKKTFNITQNDVRLTVQVPDAPETAEKILMRVTISNLGSEPISIGEDGRQPFCSIQVVTTKGERCELTTKGENTVGINVTERIRARYRRLAPSETMSWTFPMNPLFKLKPDSYLLKLIMEDVGQSNGVGKSCGIIDNVAFTIKAG